ncbi:MAG TPA: hypothetical protein DGK91_14950 [Clostridium sp.]|nr:hypothetical protein [Clostridia bacterium]HCW05692.1 hypothetical protein [Clostridium sp.]
MNKSSNIARGGLSVALIVLLVYMASIAPTSKLSILAVSSAIIPYSILTSKGKNSFVVYVTASILSLVLIGPKVETVGYALFFGLYGFLKYYIERINKALYEIILKLLYFNVILFILYSLYTKLFTSAISEVLPIYAVLLLAQIAFFVFDYALTVIISYMRKRFIKDFK